MTGNRLLRRWAPKEAGIRLALSLVAALLGYLAVMHALAMVIQKRSPGGAHALAPGNGFITGELAGKLADSDATAQDRVQVDRLARLALRQDPTSADAAAALGLNAQIRGDRRSARRLFAYVQALSRRNVQTQLWEIGDAIDRNDVPAILTHYDIALRTSSDVSPLLFHTIAMMDVDPNFLAALARTLARQPAWANAFFDYIVVNGKDPGTTASLFEAVIHLGGNIPDENSASVINALIGAGRLEQAWAYYAATHPGAARDMSRDPRFQNQTEAPSAFDWTPIDDGSISASIQPDGHLGGILTFAAPPSIGGQAARQIEMLPSGNYVIEGRSEGIDQTQDARPYWSLSCNDGRLLGRVDLPNSKVASGLFRGRFTVPADCPIQVLALDLRPSSAVSGVTGQIDRAVLRPAK
jgi:hypothetical protein